MVFGLVDRETVSIAGGSLTQHLVVVKELISNMSLCKTNWNDRSHQYPMVTICYNMKQRALRQDLIFWRVDSRLSG